MSMSKNYKKSSSAVWWIIGTGLVTVVLLRLIIGASKNSSSSEITPASKTNREVALSCTTDMATQFHIHPHVQIVVNGQPQEVPAQIGIANGICMHPIHTHDNSGTLHVESPEKRDFTLADFFAVWNKTYRKDQILDYKVDQTHIIRETVNGVEVKDYENTVLHDGDQIVISYEEKK